MHGLGKNLTWILLSASVSLLEKPSCGWSKAVVLLTR